VTTASTRSTKGIAEELDSLRCVQATLRARTDVHDDELLAALGVLIRATKRIDERHTALEDWHLRRRRRPDV
jgi:hypothetical protein